MNNQTIKKIKTRAYKDRLRGHKDGVICLHSPDGPQSNYLYSASKDGQIIVWNLVDRKIQNKIFVSRITSDIIQQIQSKEEQYNQNLEDEEEYDQDEGEEGEEEEEEEEMENNLNQEYLENMEKFKKIDTQEQDQQFTCATFSENSIYAGFNDGNIYSWNSMNGELTCLYEGHLGKITQLQFLNQRQLVSTSNDHTVRVWDTMAGNNEFIFKLSGPVNYLRLQGQKVIHVIVSKNTYVRLEIDKQEVQQAIKFSHTIITNSLVHKEFLILGTLDNTIEIYNLDTLDPENIQPHKVIEGIQGWVLSMNILDSYLFIGGDDRRIRVYDMTKNFDHAEDLEGHLDGIVSIEFAGNLLFSGSFDHSIRSWDLQEMYSRIRERKYMMKEDLWSKKHDAYHDKLYAKKKKKGGKKK